jgi:hypothetical protein
MKRRGKRRKGLLVHIAPLGDGDDEDGDGLIVDGVDDPKIANAIAECAGQFAGERFDVVSFARIYSSDSKQRASFLAIGASQRS